MNVKSLLPYVGVLVLVGAVFFTVRSVLSGPSTAPREADKLAAERTIKTAGSGDERTVIPRDNLVAGNAVVEPRDRETKVAPAVPGRIARIAVQEGERVSKGALLVQLEDSPERAALQAADADLAAARARAVLSAEAYRRIAQAAKGAAATSDDLDRALRQAQSDSLSAEAYRARREQARSDWKRLGVRAPIDGEVLQVKCRAGEYETPGGDPLVVMGDVSVLRARVDVDERDIGRIALGNGAFVVADAFPNEKFTGKVVEIGKRMGRKNVRTDDPTERIDTKIIETVIELDKTNGLVPGMLVTGYINPTK